MGASRQSGDQRLRLFASQGREGDVALRFADAAGVGFALGVADKVEGFHGYSPRMKYLPSSSVVSCTQVGRP